MVFNNNYRGGTGNACNKISFYGGGNTPTANNNGVYGIGVEFDALEYFSNGGHAFFTNSKGGTTLGDERMRIASNGNIGIGTMNPAGKLDIYDGFIYSNGNKQPFSRTGTVGGIHYLDVPTLFDLATTNVHTCEIVFKWEVTGTVSTTNMSLYGQIGQIQHSPFESGYKESSYASVSYSGGSGNLIARYVEVFYGDGISCTTKIRVTKSSKGVNSRNTYYCDTIYCLSGVGQAQNISIGYFAVGGVVGQFTHIRIGTNSAAPATVLTGNYTATYYHV